MLSVGKFVSALSLGLVVASSASGELLLAGWTIPTRFPVAPNVIPTGTEYLAPLAVNPDGTYNANPNLGGTTWNPALAGRADIGLNALQAGHALSSVHNSPTQTGTTTTYTSPAGNGSDAAFSSNNWRAGNYYQAQFSTLGHEGISFAFDLTRSSTGPASVTVIMSVDGGTSWSTLIGSYSVIAAGGSGTNTTNWSSTVYQSQFTSTLQLGALADNQSSVLVRVQALVDSVNSSGAFQSGGTMRIDNVFVNAVPAPGAIALLGVAGLVMRRRR